MPSVLHIIDPSVGRHCLQQLSLLVRPGERIVSTGPASLDRLGPDAVEVTSMTRPFGSDMLCGLVNRRAARGAAVIHAWSSAAATAATPAAMGNDARVVLSLDSAPRGRALNRLRKNVAAWNWAVTVTTESARTSLLNAGLGESTVYILPPAVKVFEVAHRRRQQTRQAMSLSDQERLVIIAGTNVLPSGCAMAVRVVSIVHYLTGNLRIALDGAGGEQYQLRRFLHSIGEQDLLIDTRRSFSPDDLFCSGDAAVFLSDRGGSMWAMAAAMAAGLNVLATRTPEVVECTAGGAATILVTPRDVREGTAELLKLVEQDDLAERLGIAGRRHARESFNVAAVRHRLDEIYDHCL